MTSKSSVWRARKKARNAVYEDIKTNFNPTKFQIVHWDEKAMRDLKSQRKKVKRLSVSISGIGTDQLLGAPMVSSGSGETQANAIFKLLSEWNLLSNVNFMCSDTTGSNTGIVKGACVLLQRKMKKEMIYLACRHHQLEVVAGGAFEALDIEQSTSPEHKVLKTLQDKWESVEKGKY